MYSFIEYLVGMELYWCDQEVHLKHAGQFYDVSAQKLTRRILRTIEAISSWYTTLPAHCPKTCSIRPNFALRLKPAHREQQPSVDCVEQNTHSAFILEFNGFLSSYIYKKNRHDYLRTTQNTQPRQTYVSATQANFQLTTPSLVKSSHRLPILPFTPPRTAWTQLLPPSHPPTPTDCIAYPYARPLLEVRINLEALVFSLFRRLKSSSERFLAVRPTQSDHPTLGLSLRSDRIDLRMTTFSYSELTKWLSERFLALRPT